MRGVTFSTRWRKISSPPGESISHLAEIEFPGGGNISAGGRLYKGAIPFRITYSAPVLFQEIWNEEGGYRHVLGWCKQARSTNLHFFKKSKHFKTEKNRVGEGCPVSSPNWGVFNPYGGCKNITAQHFHKEDTDISLTDIILWYKIYRLLI